MRYYVMDPQVEFDDDIPEDARQAVFKWNSEHKNRTEDQEFTINITRLIYVFSHPYNPNREAEKVWVTPNQDDL